MRAEVVVSKDSGLRANRTHDVVAQLIDADGLLGPPGPPEEFTVADLAAELNPDPCSGEDCHPADVELFSGTLPATDSITLDVSELTAASRRDWVGDAEMEARPSAPRTRR